VSFFVSVLLLIIPKVSGCAYKNTFHIFSVIPTENGSVTRSIFSEEISHISEIMDIQGSNPVDFTYPIFIFGCPFHASDEAAAAGR
jgi:hypothetical protein